MLLNKIPFFSDFTAYERERISEQHANFYAVLENEFIIEQNTLDTSFYVLMNGSARVTLNSVPEPVAQVSPGDFFGEISFVQNTPRTSNVVANSLCIVFRIDRRVLGALPSDIREKIKDQIIYKLIKMVNGQNRRTTAEEGILPDD